MAHRGTVSRVIICRDGRFANDAPGSGEPSDEVLEIVDLPMTHQGR